MGVFDRVARGLSCAPGSAFTRLAPLCPPSARPVGAKTTPSVWLHSYAKNHRSWRAWLRTAQVGQFGGDFGLPARLLGAPQTIPEDAQAELGHCAKQEWVVHCHQALAGQGRSLGRAGHSHPSKHALGLSNFFNCHAKKTFFKLPTTDYFLMEVVTTSLHTIEMLRHPKYI